MKTSEIINLLLEILRDETMRNTLGAEFTNFIVKWLFDNRTFWLNTENEICYSKHTIIILSLCSL